MSLVELYYFRHIEDTNSIQELTELANEGDKLGYGSIRLRAEAKIKELQHVEEVRGDVSSRDQG